MTTMLAMMAVLVPASITLVGYWLTRQSDRRLEQDRQEAEARRQIEYAEQSARLRLDAAMRAADLFVGADGSADAAASASGLLALAELEQADLAVALLVDLWSGPESADRRGAVSTETAILVINAAIQDSARPTTQLIAAELLCRNAHRLDPCQSLHWPAAIDGCWVPEMSARAKLLLVDGLVRMTTHGSPSENALRSVLVRLYGIWSGDPNPRVRGCVGTLIARLLPAIEELGYSEFMQGNETVRLEELRTAAASASPNPDGFLERLVADRAEVLGQWTGGCNECSFHAGALGTAAPQL